jgi:chromosome segregation ATPase
MGKADDTEIKGNNEEIKSLLNEINQKIRSAKVLNGGFDTLQTEVAQIKNLQAKLNADFEAHKVNDTRIEEKLDRLYDPEDGIYSKIHKSETMMTALHEKVGSLNSFDEKIQVRLSDIEKKADTAQSDIKQIQKIAGEDNKELAKAVKLGKGVWWFLGFAITGLLSAVGKFLWDLFVG